MKRFYWSAFSVIVMLAVSARPVFAAPRKGVPAQATVTASAVVVPAQVSELGFLISGMAREIPIQAGETVQAGQTLMILDVPELQFAVEEAQAGLRVAQAEQQIRRNEVIKKFVVEYRKQSVVVEKLRLGVPHEVLEIANTNVQRAQASVDFAQARLAQGTLLAPHTGTITAINVIPGEFVSSDRAVVTLATLDTLQIETTDLNERDIPNVHLGDPANIFVEALNENIPGKVIGISPIADNLGGDVVFKVTIAPDLQPQGLLWGMTAEVEIRSEG